MIESFRFFLLAADMVLIIASTAPSAILTPAPPNPAMDRQTTLFPAPAPCQLVGPCCDHYFVAWNRDRFGVRRPENAREIAIAASGEMFKGRPSRYGIIWNGGAIASGLTKLR